MIHGLGFEAVVRANRLFPEVRRVLLLQLALMPAMSLMLMLAAGYREGFSILIGGAVAFLPNLLFAGFFGRNNPRKNARQVVAAFYRGEIAKLALTVLLFAAAFRYSEIILWSFFTGFMLVLMMTWFALLLRK
jgi:ATP synthase protein I